MTELGQPGKVTELGQPGKAVVRGTLVGRRQVIGNLARARLRQGVALEEVRPLLEQLVFYDSRPDWIS